MLILTDGIKTIHGRKLTVGTGLNLSESADGLPILHYGGATGVPTGNSTATQHRAVVLNAMYGAGLRLPALPELFTIWQPRQQVRYDVSAFTEVRNVVTVDGAGNAGSGLDAEFSLDGVNWSAISVDNIAAPLSATGTWTGGWGRMRADCTGDVYLRWGTGGGDGVSSPRVGNVVLEFRYGAPRSTRQLVTGGATCYVSNAAWDADWTKESQLGATIGINGVSNSGSCSANIVFDGFDGVSGGGGYVWYRKTFGGFEPHEIITVTANLSRGSGYDLTSQNLIWVEGADGRTSRGAGIGNGVPFSVAIAARATMAGTVDVGLGPSNLGWIINGLMNVSDLQFWREV